MNIHEYQARELLEQHGIPVPPGIVVETAQDAAKAYEELAKRYGATLAVVKAQVHAGGRGKGGGVKLVRSAQEAHEAAKTILSKNLVTPQTPPEGVPVNKLLIAAGVDIVKEYYIAITIDRSIGMPVLMASAEGGMDIEEIAETHPEAIIRQPVSSVAGLRAYEARKLAYFLGFHGGQVRQASKIITQLVELFLERDCSIAEINPLIVTPPSTEHPDGRVLAIDAKLNFDENSVYRQEQLKAFHDPAEEDPDEVAARKYGLSYIALDGNIGCLVNGAGLAMATMDIIKLHGGEPANFLDVGGSASEEAVTEAFRIILNDPKVKGILVNIFGGIAKCDTIAAAIITAAKEVGFTVPLVVRLEGTNVDKAREMLEAAKADIPTLQTGRDITEAAKLITSAIGVGEPAGA
ncbi:MAG: ADP-forming succinate--CoA ligase subunit beta [Planctomycetota bacterium]